MLVMFITCQGTVTGLCKLSVDKAPPEEELEVLALEVSVH